MHGLVINSTGFIKIWYQMVSLEKSSSENFKVLGSYCSIFLCFEVIFHFMLRHLTFFCCQLFLLLFL